MTSESCGFKSHHITLRYLETYDITLNDGLNSIQTTSHNIISNCIMSPWILFQVVPLFF